LSGSTQQPDSRIPEPGGDAPCGWWHDHERRLTVLCAATLLGLLLLFYHRLWWPGLILIKRDAFRFFAPIKAYIAERILAGELPQWFPYESLGRSLIGTTVTGLFHPFTALYVALSAHDALRLSTLLACLMGGLGAFVLGRTLLFSRVAAVVAGLAFACSGYVVSTTEAIQYLYGICALPLFCATLGKAAKAGSAWMTAPAAIWATVFLGGDIQTGYYYGFIALLWVLTLTDVPPRQAVARTACVGLLAGLLGGVQLAPSFAAFLSTERTDPELFHEAALLWSTHPLRVLTVLAGPVGSGLNQADVAHFFFGSLPPGRMLVGLLTDSLYLGVPVVGLALVGARARPDLRGLVWLGLAALWLALGRYGGLYEVFYHLVPLWSAFRYPEKLMGIASFAVAMLAGAGVDALCDGRGRPLFWFALAACCAGLWGIAGIEAVAPWGAARSGAPVALTREVLDSLARAALFSGMAASGVGLVVVALRQRRLPVALLVGTLAAIVMLDLSRANQEAYHTGPKEAASFTPGLAEAIARHAGMQGAGHFRIFTDSLDRIVYPEFLNESLGVTGATSLVFRQALHTEFNAAFRIESINVYMPGQSAMLTRLRELVSKDYWVRAYARYNVAYLIGLRERFSEPPFPQAVIATLPAYGLAVVKNPIPPAPRAYLSRRPQAVSSSMDLSALMKEPGFLSGTTDFIEVRDGVLPPPDQGGQAAIELYAPEEVRVRVRTPAAASLIVLDAFEDGWRASLEGGEALPIRRANALVRAVTVPAGTHLVTFTYRTPLLILGAWLSLAGVLACAGLIGHAARRPLHIPASRAGDAGDSGGRAV